jgi:predicted metal-dependent hydrolase
MNTDARNNIHLTKEALKTAQQGLQAAISQAENTTIKNEISTQLSQVTTCLQECEKIASGLSQHLNH